MANAASTENQNIQDLFEDELQTDLFNARCHDTGDSTTSKLESQN